MSTDHISSVKIQRLKLVRELFMVVVAFIFAPCSLYGDCQEPAS